MKVVLELLRIIFIFLVLMGILGAVFENIYRGIGNGAENYRWISWIAIFIVIFVLYRNKYQFSGWYKGEGQEKLSKKVSLALMTISVILLVLPPIISFLLN